MLKTLEGGMVFSLSGKEVGVGRTKFSSSQVIFFTRGGNMDELDGYGWFKLLISPLTIN